MSNEIKNAVIESVRWDMERGLSCWLMLDYGGSGQEFGGYLLYGPKGWAAHEDAGNYCGHFVYRCLQIAGVEDMKDLPGKTIRVRGGHSSIEAIGHIVKDDWFSPSDDFKAIQAKFKATGEKS